MNRTIISARSSGVYQEPKTVTIEKHCPVCGHKVGVRSGPIAPGVTLELKCGKCSRIVQIDLSRRVAM